MSTEAKVVTPFEFQVAAGEPPVYFAPYVFSYTLLKMLRPGWVLCFYTSPNSLWIVLKYETLEENVFAYKMFEAIFLKKEESSVVKIGCVLVRSLLKGKVPLFHPSMQSLLTEISDYCFDIQLKKKKLQFFTEEHLRMMQEYESQSADMQKWMLKKLFFSHTQEAQTKLSYWSAQALQLLSKLPLIEESAIDPVALFDSTQQLKHQQALNDLHHKWNYVDFFNSKVKQIFSDPILTTSALSLVTWTRVAIEQEYQKRYVKLVGYASFSFAYARSDNDQQSDYDTFFVIKSHPAQHYSVSLTPWGVICVFGASKVLMPLVDRSSFFEVTDLVDLLQKELQLSFTIFDKLPSKFLLSGKVKLDGSSTASEILFDPFSPKHPFCFGLSEHQIVQLLLLSGLLGACVCVPTFLYPHSFLLYVVAQDIKNNANDPPLSLSSRSTSMCNQIDDSLDFFHTGGAARKSRQKNPKLSVYQIPMLVKKSVSSANTYYFTVDSSVGKWRKCTRMENTKVFDLSNLLEEIFVWKEWPEWEEFEKYKAKWSAGPDLTKETLYKPSHVYPFFTQSSGTFETINTMAELCCRLGVTLLTPVQLQEGWKRMQTLSLSTPFENTPLGLYLIQQQQLPL